MSENIEDKNSKILYTYCQNVYDLINTEKLNLQPNLNIDQLLIVTFDTTDTIRKIMLNLDLQKVKKILKYTIEQEQELKRNNLLQQLLVLSMCVLQTQQYRDAILFHLFPRLDCEDAANVNLLEAEFNKLINNKIISRI